jgi:hypothetical protein
VLPAPPGRRQFIRETYQRRQILDALGRGPLEAFAQQGSIDVLLLRLDDWIGVEGRQAAGIHGASVAHSSRSDDDRLTA